MGNCCSGRGNLSSLKTEGQTVLNPKDPANEVIDKGLFSSIGASYISNKQGYINKHFSVTSINDKKATAELLLLNDAKEKVDIRKLVELLDSDTVIVIDENIILHTWADNPKTIGALAASQIGIFASEVESYSAPCFIEDIIQHGTVEKLLNFANSLERDKFEAAVLALSFLTENCKLHVAVEIVERILKKNAMNSIVRHMHDTKEGLRSTASICCRNLYLGRPVVQRQFMNLGGGYLLMQLLGSSDATIVFETVLNLLDLILVKYRQDSEDRINSDIKMHLHALNIAQKLDDIIKRKEKLDSETVNEVIKLKELFD